MAIAFVLILGGSVLATRTGRAARADASSDTGSDAGAATPAAVPASGYQSAQPGSPD